MRAHPAFQITLRRFGAWRGAVWVAGCTVALTMVTWALATSQDRPFWMLVACAASLAGALWLGASLSAVVPLSLRWDGQGWYLGPAHTAGHEPWPGEVTVCIDLGAWLLLRFRHRTTGLWPTVTWLPAQRHGQQTHWHALRCALYAPRPTPGRGGADIDS